MKFLIVWGALLCLPASVWAQNTAIPDPVFEQLLIDWGYDSGVVDGVVPTANIGGMGQLYLHNENLTDLTGIRDFVSLTSLVVTSNNLTFLDVSGMVALEYLKCSNNNIASLNVSDCNNLGRLYCDNNELPTLDIAGLPAVYDVTCYGNVMTSLNASGAVALRKLSCANNLLTSVNTTGCTGLEEFWCHQNELAVLDVSGLPSLRKLYCSQNQLTSLNVSGLLQLQILTCDNNQLTSLDASGLSSVYMLQAGRNALTSLNVSGMSGLVTLICNYNELPSLDLTGLLNLKTMQGWYNQFTAFNISGLPSLQQFACQFNPQLTTVIASGLPSLRQLYFNDCQVSTLNLSNLNSLERLWCENNQLASIDVSGLAALKTLRCGNNQLTALDLTGLSSLNHVACEGNQLTTLDCSGLLDLEGLSCFNNQLTSLHVGGLPNFHGLYCQQNNLSTVTMTNVDFTAVSSLNAADNPPLTCIEVDNATEAYTVQFLDLDAQTGFYPDCSAPCDPPVISVSTTPDTCDAGTGTATVTATGGTGAYTYLWLNGGTSNSVSGLAHGIASAIVTDSIGCASLASDTVASLSIDGLSVTHTRANCAGTSDGTASAVATGGTLPYTYTWNNGGTTAVVTGLDWGTHSVTVHDANGCSNTGSTYLLVNGSSSIATTQLNASSCGITLGTLNQYIYAQSVPGAERYQYRFTNQASNAVATWFSPSSNPTATFASLLFVAGAVYGATYDVEVRVKVGGVWGCYGPTCTVTTPAGIPATQLSAAYCNATLNTLNTYFYWNHVVNAERYELEITGPAGFSHTAYSLAQAPTGTYLALSFVPGILYNTTYNVRVRAKVGGVWGSLGPTCTLSTPASTPMPAVHAQYCNSTLGSINQYITFTGVPGASRYQHEVQTTGGSVQGTGFSPFYAPTLTKFSMYFIPGIQASTSYDVAVRAKVNGTWQGYGPSCRITTPVFKRGSNGVASRTPNRHLLTAAPNPTQASSTIYLRNERHRVRATVRNSLGQVVAVQQFGTTNSFELSIEGAPGIYFVSVTAEEGLLGQLKLVKQ